jgi:hypothetical protein
MINLQMPQGKNNAKKAAAYLLSDTDHTGKTRAVKPEILDGDPHRRRDFQQHHKSKKVCLWLFVFS